VSEESTGDTSVPITNNEDTASWLSDNLHSAMDQCELTDLDAFPQSDFSVEGPYSSASHGAAYYNVVAKFIGHYDADLMFMASLALTAKDTALSESATQSLAQPQN